MAPSQSRVKQEQLQKRRNNLPRRINDFWRLYGIRSWVILEMPNRRIYTYQSHPLLPAPTVEQLVSRGVLEIWIWPWQGQEDWSQPVIHRTPANYASQPMTNVVIPRPPTFNILGRQNDGWDYVFSQCGVY
ncbi:hypothetical protein AAWM_07269 [Aspergillus awamori]|uniref:Uncharacterized protein n=1 Tax=Aspergillus awamori TaxID=105351 RepID=A0A401KYQ8_ASPAW|nr:hypothetical protein AAWM_07269 [Aspergillus awamori]